MLMVNASAKPSKIQGLGVFANERIPKGTTTWKFNPRFDLVFDQKEIDAMEPRMQQFMQTYSYLSKTTKQHIFSADDSRFTNHSAKPNVDTVYLPGEIHPIGTANRDIEAGEELTADYRQFDALDEVSNEPYLNA